MPPLTPCKPSPRSSLPIQTGRTNRFPRVSPPLPVPAGVCLRLSDNGSGWVKHKAWRSNELDKISCSLDAPLYPSRTSGLGWSPCRNASEYLVYPNPRESKGYRCLPLEARKCTESCNDIDRSRCTSQNFRARLLRYCIPIEFLVHVTHSRQELGGKSSKIKTPVVSLIRS